MLHILVSLFKIHILFDPLHRDKVVRLILSFIFRVVSMSHFVCVKVLISRHDVYHVAQAEKFHCLLLELQDVLLGGLFTALGLALAFLARRSGFFVLFYGGLFFSQIWYWLHQLVQYLKVVFRFLWNPFVFISIFWNGWAWRLTKYDEIWVALQHERIEILLESFLIWFIITHLFDI